MTYDAIKKKMPHFPILHIADCIAYQLKLNNITRIGLVGTLHTMQKDYIIGRLKLHGITTVVPSNMDDHNEIERIIEKELSFAKFIDKSRQYMVKLIQNDLVNKQRAQGCILGCTEIELLVKQKDIKNVKLFNSAEIHINAAVDVQLCKKNVWDFEPNSFIKARL